MIEIIKKVPWKITSKSIDYFHEKHSFDDLSLRIEMYFVEKVVDFCMLMKFCDLVVDRTEEVKKNLQERKKDHPLGSPATEFCSGPFKKTSIRDDIEM
jgi:hypothetical protein